MIGFLGTFSVNPIRKFGRELKSFSNNLFPYLIGDSGIIKSKMTKTKYIKKKIGKTGTVIFYGRNNTVQKIAISVTDKNNKVVEIKRYWVADGWTPQMILPEAEKLFKKHSVTDIVMTDPTKELLELNVDDPEDFNCEPFPGN
jgi:hypothetical protein